MKTSIYSQHHEHSEWLNKLSFYDDELTLMQKKLEEVSSKNTGLDIRKSIEHFQNQLIVQKANSADLRRHIRKEEAAIQAMIQSNPVASDHRRAEDHTKERDSLDAFEKNFNHLRQEFNLFLAKTL